ncbi:MAG TPA: CPBP family intramembrane metalloprotease [Phycisphaerae bacterium]|nr:CPBP family intramembrane metalloprotease [Phycisphaerae bacterium]HRR87060.1 CPBP family intramembrane metalloprotease [Phycisphaerae bacterium]
MNEEAPTQFNEASQDSKETVGTARPVALVVETAPAVEPARRPRVWTVFAAYVSTIVLGTIVTMVHLVITLFGVAPGDWIDELAKRPLSFLWVMSYMLFAALLVAFCAAFLSPVRWVCRLRLTAPSLSCMQVATAAVGAVAIGLTFSMAYALDFLPRSSTLEPLSAVIAGLLGLNLILGIVVIGILPAISEELLFRGYLQTRLTQRWGARISILLTALMFAAYHMDVSQGILALGVGIYLGFVVERGNSIVPAIIGHAVNNTVALLLSVFLPDTLSRASLWVILLAAAVVLGLCLWHLRSAVPPDRTCMAGA